VPLSLQCVSLEIPPQIGYAKPARHLGRVEDQSNHEDDVYRYVPDYVGK
jgi:hypothetical protein